MTSGAKTDDYRGFEQGPIRPPSEAGSLLVRVTRNCHWNRCAFCPVYKGTAFSIRPPDQVLADLDAVAGHLERLRLIQAGPGILWEEDVRLLLSSLPPRETASFRAAVAWYASGMESVFLQDADCLTVRPGALLPLLTRIRALFPTVTRITCYSRSDTIARLSAEALRELRKAGLNRIHVGMESGCDRVLALMCKGATGEGHVKAGLMVKDAGIELSEYFMPGLGGRDLWREHAGETADAVSRIDPDFIRLRTLAIPEGTPLAGEVRAGRFCKCPDVLVAEEILLFLESLHGVTGFLASDHVLNLLPELEGRLPGALEPMKDLVREFLHLDGESRFIYQLGRRTGIMSRVSDTRDPGLRALVLEAARKFKATPENVDGITDAIVRRFI